MISREGVTAEMLSAVKNMLNITWDDSGTDERICAFIGSATAYLDGIGGGALDYDNDGMARTLMMEYVRYARDEALDVFENNYQALILALKNGRAIDAYVEETRPTEE